MENQQINSDPIDQTPLTPKEPVTPDISTEIPTDSTTSNPYQPVLDQYAATSSPPAPTEVLPPVPNYQENSNRVDDYSDHPSQLPKIIFLICLVFFVLVITSLGFVYYKSSGITPSSNSTFETTQNNPSPTPSGSCQLNDNTYMVGESFAASDGCNTCTCETQDSISCSNNQCLSTTPATKSGDKTTITPTLDFKTYNNSKLGFSFRYPTDFTVTETDQSIILKSNYDTFTIYFSNLGRGFEGVNSFIKYDATIKNNLVILSNQTRKISKTLETANGDILTKGYAITTTTKKYTFIMEGDDVSRLDNGISSFEQILNSFKFN